LKIVNQKLDLKIGSWLKIEFNFQSGHYCTSDMDTSIKSHIELLPNELWLRVFAYTPLRDLYYAWQNLNSHIDAILRSAYIGIYIENKNDENISYKNMMMHFSSQIVHIKDERLNTALSSQISPIDLLSFVNFRSLYLARCSQDQFEQLLNLHQLTRLSLPCDYVGQSFFERFVIGKNKEERFPQLRSIGRIMCFDVDKQQSSFTVNRKIQHVHLVILSSNSTANFLQYLPELSLITVDYLGNHRVFSSSCFIMAKIRRQNNDDFSKIFSQKDVSLKHDDQNKSQLRAIAKHISQLEIDFHGHCNFTELAYMLQQCPILEKVRIRIKYYPNNLDLASIRHLNPFFATLTFGDVHKDTNKPVIITKT
jgi:hypothetical protein